MDALQAIEWEDCFLEPRQDADLEREVRLANGFVLPTSRLFYHSPWLTRTLLCRSYRRDQLVHIDLDLAELIFLAVSQESSCRFCYTGTRGLLRILGLDEQRIQRVEDAATRGGEPRERLATDLARRISRSNPAPGADDLEALRRAGYGDEAIRELAYLAAYTVFVNRCTTLTALPLHMAGPPLRRWLWLLGPLLGRRFRSLRRRGAAQRLPTELREGPFAYVALELDGLPAARTLREGIDAALASPVLTRRSKALAFAVVARGLGSQRSEEEALGLLAEQGLGRERVEEILSHLTAPELDPLEALVLPFARESIRPRPAAIQRKARKLHDELGSERFLELVGVVGLANCVGRLSLVLCES